VAYTQPTVSDFKLFFTRDFPYGVTNQTVMDSDIFRAITQTSMDFPVTLFPDQGSYNVGFLLLSAHNLVMNLRASSQGINGQFAWLQGSRSVGSVSESISIPQRILDNPMFSYLSKTNYGTQYLMMILPLISGQVFTVEGATLP
jgi:hypothetical protein